MPLSLARVKVAFFIPKTACCRDTRNKDMTNKQIIKIATSTFHFILRSVDFPKNPHHITH